MCDQIPPNARGRIPRGIPARKRAPPPYTHKARNIFAALLQSWSAPCHVELKFKSQHRGHPSGAAVAAEVVNLSGGHTEKTVATPLEVFSDENWPCPLCSTQLVGVSGFVLLQYMFSLCITWYTQFATSYFAAINMIANRLQCKKKIRDHGHTENMSAMADPCRICIYPRLPVGNAKQKVGTDNSSAQIHLHIYLVQRIYLRSNARPSDADSWTRTRPQKQRPPSMICLLQPAWDASLFRGNAPTVPILYSQGIRCKQAITKTELEGGAALVLLWYGIVPLCWLNAEPPSFIHGMQGEGRVGEADWWKEFGGLDASPVSSVVSCGLCSFGSEDKMFNLVCSRSCCMSYEIRSYRLYRPTEEAVSVKCHKSLAHCFRWAICLVLEFIQVCSIASCCSKGKNPSTRYMLVWVASPRVEMAFLFFWRHFWEKEIACARFDLRLPGVSRCVCVTGTISRVHGFSLPWSLGDTVVNSEQLKKLTLKKNSTAATLSPTCKGEPGMILLTSTNSYNVLTPKDAHLGQCTTYMRSKWIDVALWHDPACRTGIASYVKECTIDTSIDNEYGTKYASANKDQKPNKTNRHDCALSVS